MPRVFPADKADSEMLPKAACSFPSFHIRFNRQSERRRFPDWELGPGILASGECQGKFLSSLWNPVELDPWIALGTAPLRSQGIH